MFEQAYQFVIEQLSKNDLVAGGAVLGVLAYILNQLRSLPFQLLRWSRLLFVTQIDIPDRSDAFRWVSDWLSDHQYSKKAKRITVECRGPRANVTPAPGRHLIFWRKRPLILERVRNEGTGDNAHRAFRESWSISFMGSRQEVEDFVAECRDVSRSEKKKYIRVFEVDRGFWEEGQRRRKRSLDSVLLPIDVQKKIISDVKDFIDSKDWYEQMNIPWRRGYLLSGPPGNGKSSIITAIASEIDFKIHTINLSDIASDDLIHLISNVEDNSILLLEDIDCAFNAREGKTNLSLSLLLNLLDGVSATEGRLLFMTTNYPENLDPALIRPGRIDLSIELKNATYDQILRMFKRFFPESRNAEAFAAKVAEYDISMAKLQGYLLTYRKSARDAHKNVKELLDA